MPIHIILFKFYLKAFYIFLFKKF